MKYLVIGLGNLGRAIAESLTCIGNEVIGVDINPHKTEAVNTPYPEQSASTRRTKTP